MTLILKVVYFDLSRYTCLIFELHDLQVRVTYVNQLCTSSSMCTSVRYESWIWTLYRYLCIRYSGMERESHVEDNVW